MGSKFAGKSLLCGLGLIAMGAVSVSAFAQSAEYRRGYDQGYRDAMEAQGHQGHQGQQDGPRGRIRIEEARYGLRNASCDARDAVQQAAGGRHNATIVANNELCGDPARGSQKTLWISYRCGDGAAFRAETREGGTATLSCR
jgi:hypothetical protein